MKKSLFLLPLLASPALAQEAAQPTPTPSATPVDVLNDENETVITITDRRNPRPLANTPSSVTVITPEEIEAKEPFDLASIVRRVPGVTIVQNGGPGKTASIFLRGTNSNHTLVLLDGIRANNPNDGRFDFGQIPVENIERIEVVRGATSALYGSDAIGGVINIITKRGFGEFRIGGRLEYGSEGTNRQSIDGGGQWGKNRLSFSAFRRDSDGEFENDDYRDNGLSLRYDRELSASQNLTFTTRYDKARFGVPGQRDLAYDPFQRDNTQDFSTSLQWTNRAGKRRDQITVGFYDRQLRDDDRNNPGSPAPNVSRFDNQVRTIEAQTAYNFGKNTLTGGLEDRKESADVLSSSSFGDTAYRGDTTTRAIFLQNEYKNGNLLLVPGIRYEDNSQFGDFTSYRIAANYKLGARTHVKGSYGTAFKAPNYSLLYYPNFSNPNLDPERSRGYDLGIVQELGNGGRIEATAFRNKITDLIQFSPTTFLPENLDSARTQGIELALDTPLSKNLRLVANSTWTQVESDSGPLLRRPRFAASADLIAQRGRWSYDLGFFAQGKRYDSNFVDEFSPVLYDGFQRVDLTVGYTLKSGVELYARAGNLFDEEYTEAAGFKSPGFNVVLGIKTARF